MPIKVNVSLSAGGQLKPVSSRTLDGAHITIGRDKECSLTLEDTQKHVSRVHAKLDVEAGTYLMTVVSKVNPVMVNGKRHMYEERVALSDGDVLTIGLYKLEILIPPVPSRAAPPPPPPPPPPPRPVAPPAAAFAEDMTYIPPAPAEAPAQPISAIPDDFSEDMTYVPPSRSRAPAAAPPAASLPISAGADADATYIPPAPAEPPPDDEVTFVRPASEMTNPLGRASKIVAPPEDVEEDFSEEMTYVRRPAPAPTPPAPPPPPPAVQDVEEDFSEDATYVRRPGPAAPPPAAPAPTPVAPPPPATEDVEEDFSEDATYVRRPGTPAPVPQSVAAPAEELDIEIDFELSDSADLSEEMTLYRPSATEAPVATPPDSLADEPTQYRPRVDAAVPAAGAAAPAGGADGKRLLQAFLEGAGLDRLEIDDPETFLRDSGATVRAAIEGVMMLLLASTAVKKSLGTETEENSDTNPLKTLSNPAKAIAFLFDPATRTADGPDPVQALGDACSDLRVHQIALMSAMQAAVLTALQRVDPKAVEREHGSSLGGLTLNKKSKLWDLAVAHHERVALEVGESINRVFGPEVQAAYAAEVRRIRGGR